MTANLTPTSDLADDVLDALTPAQQQIAVTTENDFGGYDLRTAKGAVRIAVDDLTVCVYPLDQHGYPYGSAAKFTHIPANVIAATVAAYL